MWSACGPRHASMPPQLTHSVLFDRQRSAHNAAAAAATRQADSETNRAALCTPPPFPLLVTPFCFSPLIKIAAHLSSRTKAEEIDCSTDSQSVRRRTVLLCYCATVFYSSARLIPTLLEAFNNSLSCWQAKLCCSWQDKHRTGRGDGSAKSFVELQWQEGGGVTWRAAASAGSGAEALEVSTTAA